ncbi:MAG: hypothetical protein MJ072_02695, partial [Clostridia bacterium]|nr:hypothetical protein [Clostridia bacterium]
VQEEVVVTEDVESEETGIDYRYRYSFTARLIQSPDEVQGYYEEIKNYLLSYAKVKDKMAWGYEAYRYGKANFLKMKIRGKAIVLYMDLDAKTLDEKYYAKDLTKEDGTKPALATLYKVKSARGVRFAKELIDLIMANYGAIQGDIPAESYRVPYQTTEELFTAGLVKDIQ